MSEDKAIIPYSEVEIITKQFDEEIIDFIHQDDKLWIPARTLGIALGYKNPRKAIMDLYYRNKDEIDQYSAVLDLRTAGKLVKTRVFEEKGILKLLMFSRKPKAKQFREWVSDVILEIKKKGFYVEQSIVKDQIVTTKYTPEMIIKQAEIFMHQLAMMKTIAEEQLDQKDKIARLEAKMQEMDDNKIIMDETFKKLRDYIYRINQQYHKWIWEELRTHFTFSKLERIPENKGRMILLYMKKKYPLIE